MGILNFKSSRFQVILFTLILTVSLLFNVMYFLGIIEYKLKTKKELEFIDSPIDRPYIDSPPKYRPVPSEKIETIEKELETINEMELMNSPIDESKDSIVNRDDSDSIKK